MDPLCPELDPADSVKQTDKKVTAHRRPQPNEQSEESCVTLVQPSRFKLGSGKAKRPRPSWIAPGVGVCEHYLKNGLGLHIRQSRHARQDQARQVFE